MERRALEALLRDHHPTEVPIQGFSQRAHAAPAVRRAVRALERDLALCAPPGEPQPDRAAWAAARRSIARALAELEAADAVR